MKNLFKDLLYRVLPTLLLTLSLPASTYGQAPPQANDNAFNHVSFRSLPALNAGNGKGVSGAFTGCVGNRVIVAGGCNFPHVPAAQGGAKMFYKDIYELTLNTAGQAGWKKVGELPQPLAYGVSVNVPGGIIFVGGTGNGTIGSKAVNLLHKTGEKWEFTPLPALPLPLDNMAGAYGGGCLYIAGGLSDGEASKAVFRLAYPGGKQWERLPDYPGRPRVQPVAAVQNHATGSRFYLMGGFAPATARDTAFVHADGLAYDPAKGWRTVAPIVPHGRQEAMALVGASAVPSGCAHIVFMGGVDRSIFTEALNRPGHIAGLQARITASAGNPDNAYLSGLHTQLCNLETAQRAYLNHPSAWYKFNRELLIYHTITDTWVTESQSPLLARAGASLTACEGEWIWTGGEEKPGIRSTETTAIRMTMRPSFGVINWAVLIAYLLGMVALGYYFMRREEGANDFFKGGGRIPWWAAGISIYATMLSAITYMAYPAKAYATDWTYYPMLVTILVVSFPVIHYYLPFFRRLDVTSAYEYLERRFNAVTRLMASALFIVFMVARMALVLYLPSLALTAVTGIDLYICIMLMALVTILYCTMGGVEAVVWGDVVQGIILVGGAIFAVGYLVWETEGGPAGFWEIGMAYDKFRLFDWSLDYRTATFWVIILGGMANNLISYTSDQTVIQRYLTTKDEKAAGRSILMNGVMSVCVSIAFFAIGAGLFTFFKTHPAELDYTMGKTDTIFPFFMMSRLPQGIAGLLIAAIFAATMSTISSNINSVATAFSIDFYKRFRPASTDSEMVRTARRTCIVAGLLGMCIALLMATWEILSLLDFFQEILGLLSSGLGGLFLMGIFFPRIGGKAALCGFVVGLAAVFLTRYLTDTSFLLYGFIGLTISVLTGWICSFFLHEKPKTEGLCLQQSDIQN